MSLLINKMEQMTKKLETILFVDDQWCKKISLFNKEGKFVAKEGGDIFVAAYGKLLEQGYRFDFETAYNNEIYRYDENVVLNRIRNDDSISTVVLGMDFTEEYYGVPQENVALYRHRCPNYLLTEATRNIARVPELIQSGKYFGLYLLQSIKSEFPKIKVIMHDSADDKERVQQCLKLGASAYLKKKATYAELKNCLKSEVK